MPCNEGLRLQAYFDGELDASAALEVERHLQGCTDCAALLADLEATRQLIRRDAPYHRAPAGLRESIMASLDREEGVQTPPFGRLSFSRRFLSGAASGASATALAAMLVFFLGVPRPDPLAGDLMNAHLRSLMSDHLIDVVSSDRHTVKPWFAGHTDVSPPAADFEKEGYKLIGGRADYVDGHRAAVVVYRHGLHIVNVFAWAAGADKLPGAVTQKGYHIVCWNSADLDYCAVSDTGMDELLDLVRLIKQQ
jgi:anti-sigma factor RsiW